MNEIFDDLFYHRRDIKLSSILFFYFEAMMSVKENSRKPSTLKHFPFNNLEWSPFQFERKLFIKNHKASSNIITIPMEMAMVFNGFSNSLKNKFVTSKENEEKWRIPFQEFIEPMNWRKLLIFSWNDSLKSLKLIMYSKTSCHMKITHDILLFPKCFQGNIKNPSVGIKITFKPNWFLIPSIRILFSLNIL